MAKELPYFRFTAQEWLNDDISFLPYNAQGLFINICSMYWIRDCSITLAMLEQRYNDAKDTLKLLLESEILKHDKTTDEINILFLDEQFDLLSDSRKRRQDAGSKGGKQRSSNAKAMLKQRSSYKDKDKDKDKDKTIPPKGGSIYRSFDHLKLTTDEYDKLSQQYSKEQIDDILEQIENFSGNKKYKSLYLTAKKWLAKRNDDSAKPKEESGIRRESDYERGKRLYKYFIDNLDTIEIQYDYQQKLKEYINDTGIIPTYDEFNEMRKAW